MAGLYDGEIAFVDQQMGRLVSWLRAKGLEKKTVLVIIGDHGEGLGSHGEGTHGYFVYDYALHVPFLVATPFSELQGVRVDSQVSAVDVFPTVLALSGIDVPGQVQGRSLLPVMLHPRTVEAEYAYSESMTPSLQFGWSPLHSLRSSRYKLIKAPRPELYDLSADPEEGTNVFDQHPAVARDLMQRLDRLMDETSRGPRPRRRPTWTRRRSSAWPRSDTWGRPRHRGRPIPRGRSPIPRTSSASSPPFSRRAS